ncbi:MAG: hypothetical protein WKF58_06060 [Ilumatobacteraceae bacterium]
MSSVTSVVASGASVGALVDEPLAADVLAADVLVVEDSDAAALVVAGAAAAHPHRTL